MQRDIIIIRGSWGDLTVHARTGFIIDYDDHGKECWSPEEEGYYPIALIDASTLIDDCVVKHGECDILSVGYWTKDGVYERPMRWKERSFKWDTSKPDDDETNWGGDWRQIAGFLPAPELRP